MLAPTLKFQKHLSDFCVPCFYFHLLKTVPDFVHFSFARAGLGRVIFRQLPLNFQIFVHCPSVFLLLVSNIIPLTRENSPCVFLSLGSCSS